MSDPVQHPRIRPVRQGNAFEEAVERILDSIRLGLFRRGERLPPEQETAAMLGISRATLREALHELQVAGVLEVVRGRYGGTFVTGRTALPDETLPPVDPADVEDVLVFRAVVEPAAAELAAAASLSAAAREHLLKGGVDVSVVRHVDQANGQWVDGHGGDWNSFVFFKDPDGNEWAVQQKPASVG